VVDAVELGLVQVLVDLVVELAGGGQVVAEGLLDDHARMLGQPRRGEALDDGAEQEGRDLEVEDRRARVRDGRREALERVAVAEVARDVGEARDEALEELVVERLAAGHDGVVRPLAQVVERPVVDRDADDRAVEQPAALEPVQRSEGHLLGEIAGDPEDHEHVGRLLRVGRLRLGRRARLGCYCGGHASALSPVQGRPSMLAPLAKGVITR
jgi:hypothetical protein